MKKILSNIQYSASDLSNFLNCNHLTSLDLEAVNGIQTKPHYKNEVTEMLQQRGQEFEAEILASYIESNKSVVKFEIHQSGANEALIQALEKGVDIVYQAHLKGETFSGWADFLVKVDKPSRLGNWSYEVVDTKLATETKASAVLQICLYSQLLAEIQGVMPDYMYIKKPDGEEAFRVSDYYYYLRHIQNSFLAFVKQPTATYPEPVAHCSVCSWWEVCEKRKRDDDYLSYVAGMGSAQAQVFKEMKHATLEAVATLPSLESIKPRKGAKQTFIKLHHQARIQLEGRTENQPKFELLDAELEKGFNLLPEPHENDIYFDLEGDPLVGEGGREYIFGWVQGEHFNIRWAETAEEEKQVFEEFMEYVWNRIQENPGIHIYHYGHYETSALKRLMGKYDTQSEKVDSLLNSGRFVNLLQVVKQSIRASVERYSLKDLEVFHGFERSMDLRELSKFKRNYEHLLETGKTQLATEEMKLAIAKYNEEDCLSTQSLHKWLEQLRMEHAHTFNPPLARPVLKELGLSEIQQKLREQIADLYRELMENVPLEAADRNPEEQAKYLLAGMLDWYNRERKSDWWEFFRLKEAQTEELLEDKNALAYLEYTGCAEPFKRSFVFEYTFPNQDYDESKLKEKVVDENGIKNGEIVRIDSSNNRIYIKRGAAKMNDHPIAIFSQVDDFPFDNKLEAIIEIASFVANEGLYSERKDYQAARQILSHQLPTFANVTPQEANKVAYLQQLVANLDHSYLPIQGPPGAGKSYTASKMISYLVSKGKKVGITAMSHKVISNLLTNVHKDCEDLQPKPLIFQIDRSFDANHTPWKGAETLKEDLVSVHHAQILAGTPFMWANPEMRATVDYLFIDEAGQLALIDVLAASVSAPNLVLMGDPQQLEQPIQGSHPEGTDISALSHILGDNPTISEDKGVLLDVTYRMHPTVNAFVSEMFYQNKLQTEANNLNIRIDSPVLQSGAGIYVMRVAHLGNVNSAVEEVEQIVALVEQLCNGQSIWTNKQGESTPIGREHIKIISPYNAQVSMLKASLSDMEIGTVDKFQGQEAPIVIQSMATSLPEDAPRGMDFLYSSNRLNVAVSRAQGAFIWVGSEKLLQPECHSPKQMQLANAFCRLAEIGQSLSIA